MKKFLRVIILLVALVAGQAMAATCTAKTGAQAWDDKDSWTDCGNQVPKQGDTVVIPSGSTITLDKDSKELASLTVAFGGTLLGDTDNNKLKLDAPGNLTNHGTIALNDAEIDMEGNLVNTGTFNAGSDTLKLDGNFSNTGTFNAQTGEVEFDGNAAQTITGNVTFNDLKVDNGSSNGLLLKGNVIVNGSLSGNAVSGGLVKLADTCPVDYTLTSNNGNTVQHSCPGGGGDTSSCIPITVDGVASPLIAGINQLQLDKNGVVNGTTIVVAGNTSLPVTGTTSANAAGPLPALTPSTMPDVGAGTVTTTGPVASGSYGTINAMGSPTVFSGGTYYIDALNATGPIQLGAGRYYINRLDLSGNLSVTGPVQLYIGDKLEIKSNGISLNAGGNAGYLQINLYSDAEFDGDKNDLAFTGLIYSPYANSQVQFKKNLILNGAIVTAGEIQIDKNATVNFDASVQSQISSLTCSGAAALHHLEIQHTGTALTCSPATVTIRACADAECTTLYTQGGITVTPAPGGTAVTIDATGIATTTVSQASAGTVDLSATANPAATNANTCLNTVTNAASCAMTFADSGFTVTVPNHASCNPINATIEAVQKAPGSGRCVPAYQNVTREVALRFAYTNPTSGTQAINVSSGSNLSSVTTTDVAHQLAFDNVGTATLGLRYADIGQLSLTASGTAPTGAAMTGSGTFVVAPASFVVVPTGPFVAGQPFSAKVTAMNNCTTPTETPNFGKESTPETVELKAVTAATASATNSQLVGPVGGATGTLTPGAFSLAKCSPASAGSVCDTALSWTEVGDLTLAAALKSGSYLGSGLSAWGSAAAGAFKPAFFKTELDTAQPCTTFTYSGQPFRIKVTAMNAHSVTTQNYTGSYAKTVTLGRDDAAACAPSTTGFSNNTIASTAFAGTSGSASSAAETSTTSPLPISYSQALGAPTTLSVCAKDTDGVNSHGQTQATLVVRNGRARMLNAYGSELLDLPVVFRTEYVSSALPNMIWSTNTADTCTNASLSFAAVAGVTDITGSTCVLESGNQSGKGCNVPLTTAQTNRQYLESGLTGIDSNGATGFAGNFNLWLKASGARGSLTITADVPAWLESPWIGTTPTDPSARATFGIYKSPLIYRRENY